MYIKIDFRSLVHRRLYIRMQDTTYKTIDFKNITYKAITLYLRLRSLEHN
jgi:hypothetical protein